MGIPNRTAKRIYSPAALEYWFEKLNREWEPHFSDQALRRGRELYRSGVIREIEVGMGDAIIHCRFGKVACYAMVDWEGDQPRVRGSVEEVELSQSMAAAGMYEIEELVADEIDPIAITPEQGEGEESDPDRKVEEENRSGNVSIRRLEVYLSGIEAGLALKACWKNGTGASVAAWSSRRQDSSADAVSESERETLVRLTGMAHKAGFTFRSRRGDFLLREPLRIQLFLQEDLKKWRDHFHLEMDEGAARMNRGVQELQVVGKARTSGRGMRVEWQFRVGNQTLDPEQARKVIRRGHGLALLPEIGLIRLGEEQSEALEEWKSLLKTDGTVEWPRYMLFSLFANRSILLEVGGRLKEWRQAVENVEETDEVVPDFLRPYQKRGVFWLSGHCKRGCHPLLADEMGLGKTLQVLSLFATRSLEGNAGGRPHLIVCPASVVPVWRNEIARFFPALKVEVLKAGHDFLSYPVTPGTIWLASYTQLRRHKAILEKSEFGYAVLDEAQQIKNPDAKVSQACLSIRAEHRLALTGTPLENRHLDLWTLFRFLMPGLLGSRRRFEQAVDSQGRESFLGLLQRQVNPFILRRTKNEVMRELPPKVEMDLVCPLTDLQVQEYEKLTTTGLDQMGNDLPEVIRDRSLSFFTLLTRLRQVCCDPGLLPWSVCDVSNSGKINVLLGRVEEILENGKKAVVFSQFTSLLNRVHVALQRQFPDVPLFELNGKTPDRDRPVRDFQNLEGGGIILVSLRAGGVGITLHAADYVFLMDPWWNPAVENQAVDRVHRIGQEKRVFVYRMITSGTVEDRIQRLKDDKREMFERIVGEISDLGDLHESFASLKDLIRLESTSEV